MKKKTFKKFIAWFCFILLFWFFVYLESFARTRANEIYVAVASNFYNPLKEIAKQFEKQTGYKVQIIPGSTGKLYAQIINGAPFELFLAGDMRRPKLLEEEGNAVPGTRFTYALGKIALWSPNSNAISKDGKLTLKQKTFTHVAIANPITAPYGQAAVQALKKICLWNEVQPFVVHGENISQTFQFISSQNAELGFVALSQVLDPKNHKKGSWWEVPEELYDRLEQDVVLLKKGGNNPGSMELWKFLKDDLAKQTIKRYGYGLP